MAYLRRWLRRLANAIGHGRAEPELAREIAAHLALLEEEFVRRGLTHDEARLAARRAFGGVEQTKDRHRDARSFVWLDDARRDVQYALRTLRRSRGFTAFAVLTLALGIGVNTAMFSFADATAFRPPDVPRPGELVRIFGSTKDTSDGRLSYPDYLDYRDRTTTLSGVAAYRYAPVALSRTQDEIPSFVGAWVVSGNFFAVLGVPPALGRSFRDDEDRPGAAAVVVISHALWERRFGSDPSVVGTTIRLGTREFTLVGVAPPSFRGTELYLHPDLYVPIAQSRQIDSTLAENTLQDRSRRWLNVLARRRPTASIGAVSAEVSALARALQQTYTETNREFTAVALPEIAARARLDEGGYRGAAIMMGIVGLVLLMACANVANLTLARATGRTKEVVMRLALGASRGRLIRQLLTESLVLTSIGGILGVVIGAGAIRHLSSVFASNFAMSDLPVAVDMRLDARVLIFTLSVSILTGVLFGLAPAWQSIRLDLVSSLKGGSMGRRTRLPLRTALVESELALAVVVLATTGLAARSFVQQQRADPGFRTDHVLLMSFNPTLVNYSREQTTQFYRQIAERTQSMPGVEAAGLVQFIPLGVNGPASTFLVVDGYRLAEGRDRVSVISNVVDGGYWRVVRTPIVSGRPFDERDTSSSPNVVIVNETMARRYWPGESALGKTVRLGDRKGPIMQIVGIAEDGKYGSLGEPQQPCVFMPASQRFRPLMTLVALAKGSPAALVAPIRAQAQAMGGSVPVFDVRTFDDLYQSRALMPARIMAHIMTALGSLALVLAVVGVYGVIAFLTAERTREIGVRMAMGADRTSVLLLMMRHALLMIGPGIAVGAGLALLVTPAFAVPFDFAPRDTPVLAFAAAVLTGVALAASLIPARRAAAAEPVIALRCE